MNIFTTVALTGGIACGKTTVAQLLVDYNTAPVSSTNHSNSSNSNHNNSNHSNSNNHRRNKNNKRASFTASNSQSNLNSSTVVAQDEKEGTIYLVCAVSSCYYLSVKESQKWPFLWYVSR